MLFLVKTLDGIGFGVTHSMVTMMFESSLQAVNPKLSLPYWDYTIEAGVIENEYDGDYTKLREASDLWTSEWFGSVDNADFQVRGWQARTCIHADRRTDRSFRNYLVTW